jgi:soluble cytochrome b562
MEMAPGMIDGSTSCCVRSLNGATVPPALMIIRNRYIFEVCAINLYVFLLHVSSALNRMLLQLSQCELASEKFLLGSNTNDAELKSYEELNDSIKDRLETAKKEIEDAKEALRAAKEVRKNRVQYNVLAKVIKEQPDRKETLSKLDEIKSDLSDLEVCNLHQSIVR